jgi:hypothetical protein
VLTNHTITGGIAVGGGWLTMGGTIGDAGSTFTLSTGGGFSAGAISIDGTGVGAVTEGYSGIGTATFANTGTGSSIWEGGGSLAFQFKGVTSDSNDQSQAGLDWDLINNNLGSLLVTATAGNKITLLIESLSSLTSLGAAPGFDANSSNDYLWKFATNVNYLGSDSIEDRFQFDQRGVWSSGSFAGGYGSIDKPDSGLFYVQQIGLDLYVGYSSVPEPGSMLLTCLAAMGMGGYGWRRRRKSRFAAKGGDEDPIAAVVQAAAIEGPAVESKRINATNSPS